MKLALVTETFPPEVNGVAMTFGVIVRELGRRGHAVTVYRPRRDDLRRAAPSEGFTEVALPGFPIPGYPLLRLGWVWAVVPLAISVLLVVAIRRAR